MTVHITFNGETKTISDWSRATGISRPLISYRLDAGWHVADALTIKPHKRCDRRRHTARKPAKVAVRLSDVLPSLSAANNRRELDRMRRQMRRALRMLIRHTEREAAAIGRTFSITLAQMIDEQQRGVVENFSEKTGDRTHPTARESV